MTGDVLLDVRQTYGNRPLMSEIAPQVQDVDPSQSLERAPRERAVREGRRTVIHDEDPRIQAMPDQDDVQVCEEQAKGLPIVE
jgi:hypothetical protein